MRRRRRERELRALLRAPEEGCYNLADFLGAHGAELELDTTATNEPHEVLVSRLRLHVEQWDQEEERLVEAAFLSTMRKLLAGAEWHTGRVVLPSRPFFQLASSPIKKKYIRVIGDGIDVTVSRALVQRAGAALRSFHDVTVRVDAAGLHLRWGAGGGLNFHSQALKQPVETLIVTLPRRNDVRTMPALIGEILTELGYGT